MEKNLPSHQIDHYNLSSAQRSLGCWHVEVPQPHLRISVPRAQQPWSGTGGRLHSTNPDHSTWQKEEERRWGVHIQSPEQPQGSLTECTDTDLIAAFASSLCYCCSGAERSFTSLLLMRKRREREGKGKGKGRTAAVHWRRQSEKQEKDLQALFSTS